MDEEQEELVAGTDDDSLSENEDHCLPIDKPAVNYKHSIFSVEHTKIEFITVQVLLIFSTLCVSVLLPLYMEAVNAKGDVYSLIFTNTLLSTVLFTIIMVIIKFVYSKHDQIHILKLPMRWPKLALLSILYFFCGVIIVYALDRKRVVCHLQDPMKGLMLVWAFLYYFFFCQRFMCLRRIFSVTLIIVGLFIAVDYSLCNEFRCRGYDRLHVADDRGQWTWKVHTMWTVVYIIGLALCAAYFTLLEHMLLTTIEMPQETNSAALLATVSNTVSTENSCFTRDTAEDTYLYKKISTVHLAMWLHVCGVFVVIGLFWTDFIPEFGKGSNASTFLNYTFNGIRCHFDLNQKDCSNLSIFSWPFLFAYLVFVITSLKFLILTQSAVYTVATMTTALPLAGIWWSLFHMVPLQDGLLVWSPSFSGELISSFLGLPIVLAGLYVLCKSHFRDCYWSRMISNHSLPSSHLT
jgi:hypothetical protein